MGNTVVSKPSEYTPLSVLAVVELMNRHLPEGVLTVVSGGRDVGEAIAAHPDIDKVMFTGSTKTGREIVKSSAGNLARLTLEMGGNDPGIILPGTDVKAIAENLFWGVFINTGQTCAALKRLYVHDSLYEEVVDDPRRDGRGHADGPRPRRGQRARTALQQAAVRHRLAPGRRRPVARRSHRDRRRGGARARPPLLPRDGRRRHRRRRTRSSTRSSSVRRSRSSATPTWTTPSRARTHRTKGLGASVWGSDVAAAVAVAQRIEAGTVWINQHGTLNPDVPFGGVKGSGYGMEFGREGLKAVSAPKVITV